MQTPRWIFGDALDGQEYVTHTHHPRFIARIAQDGDESISGLQIVMSTGETLCDFVWLDPPVRQDHLYFQAISDAVATALIAYSEME